MNLRTRTREIVGQAPPELVAAAEKVDLGFTFTFDGVLFLRTALGLRFYDEHERRKWEARG